ncbi:MAG: hypothetical protein ICV62_06425, partial [Cyanobacteria bacterium Co-bin13]|nr:hypothetical protein [Cyanobacteria bacterium Co-bin13]
MSQYGDPKNIIRPPFRRHTPPTSGANPETPADRTAPDLRLPQPPPAAKPGGSPPPNLGSPNQPSAADPWNTRRRNQWREQQQIASPLTPTNGAQNRANVPRAEGVPTPPPRTTQPAPKSLQLPSTPPHAVAAAAAAA